MDVENVTLENVTIKNFRQGTSGYYDKDVKKRHMAGVCAIFGYTNCTITNSSLSMCTGEGFYLVPIDNNQNYTEFTHNKSIHNYGTFLTLVDGKCLVEDNYLEKFGLSGFNLFCCPLLLLPSVFPSIRVFSNGSTLRMRWPKYWSFSISMSPSNEHPGPISFRMDWLDLAVQETCKSSPTPQFKSISSSVFIFLYSPTLTYIYVY